MITVKTNKKLTIRQRIFAKEIAKGNTQRQACFIAYPNTRKWKIESVDVRANTLMKNEAIREELKKIKIQEEKEVLWTRQKATMTILNVIQENQEEQDRIEKAFWELAKVKKQKIENLEELWLIAKTDKEHIEIEKELLRAKEDYLIHMKQPIISLAYSKAIIKGIGILNKMYGYKDLGWESIIQEEVLTTEQLQNISKDILKQKEKIISF